MRYIALLPAFLIGTTAALIAARQEAAVPPSAQPTEPPLRVSLQTRDVWPIGAPWSVRVAAQPTRPPYFNWGAHVLLLENEQTRGWWVQSGGQNLIFPAEQQPTEKTLTFCVLVYEVPYLDQALMREPVSRKLVKLTTRFAGKPEDYVRGIRSPEMDEMVRSKLEPHLLRWRKDCRLDLMRHRTAIPLFDDVAFAFRAEILQDEKVVATATPMWKGGSKADLDYPTGNLSGDLDRLRAAKAGEKGWKVRLHSDPTIALQVMNATKYWEGDATFDLEIQDVD